MAKTMPFQANDVVWHILLRGCRKRENVGIRPQGFRECSQRGRERCCILRVDGQHLCSHRDGGEGQVDAGEEATKLGAWKKPGRSWWTEMAGVVYTFLVGDKSVPRVTQSIYVRLEQLIPRIEKAGYVPLLESSLLNRPNRNTRSKVVCAGTARTGPLHMH